MQERRKYNKRKTLCYVTFVLFFIKFSNRINIYFEIGGIIQG